VHAAILTFDIRANTTTIATIFSLGFPVTPTSTPIQASASNYRPAYVTDVLDDTDGDDSFHGSMQSPEASSSLLGPVLETASSASTDEELENVGSLHISPSKRRVEPKGVYIGTWHKGDYRVPAVNAVYASVDSKGRVNRRISKQDILGNIRLDGGYDSRKTACSHEHVVYTLKFANKPKAEVDAIIREVDALQRQSASSALAAALVGSEAQAMEIDEY
jgi:hypothetical protein